MGEKRVVVRDIHIALTVLCIILVAALVGTIVNHTRIINDKNGLISSKDSQIQGLTVQLDSLNRTLSDKDSQIQELTDELNSLSGRLNATDELLDFAEGGSAIRHGHTLTLRFGYDIRTDLPGGEGTDPRTFCAVYSPYDNSTLNIELKVYWIHDFNVSITLQDGNALELVTLYDYRNATAIWNVNATRSQRWATPLSRGWYTISLIGPIHLPPQCGVCVYPPPPRPPPPVINVDCSLGVTITYQGNLSPFVLSDLSIGY